jgi:toxin ParE1/3/4
MNYSLKITPQAQQDLRSIWRGLAEFSGLAIADQRLATIEQKFQLLSQFPRSGPSRDDLRPGIRSSLAGEFVIFYRVDEQFFEVVRVLHGRSDIEALFSEPEQ